MLAYKEGREVRLMSSRTKWTAIGSSHGLVEPQLRAPQEQRAQGR